MVTAQLTIGVGLLLLAALFVLAYGWPDANVVTRLLHSHWKESPIKLPGTKREITYDKYFLFGAIVLAVVGLRLLLQGLF